MHKPIFMLYRLFKIIDDDGNKKLDYNEFKKGISEYGLNYTNDEMRELFALFDKDKSGHIDFEEFLEKLRVITIDKNMTIVDKFLLLTLIR